MKMPQMSLMEWQNRFGIEEACAEALIKVRWIYHLESLIECDDAFIGGKKAGKRGRGAAGKKPILIAVERREKSAGFWLQKWWTRSARIVCETFSTVIFNRDKK